MAMFCLMFLENVLFYWMKIVRIVLGSTFVGIYI